MLFLISLLLFVWVGLRWAVRLSGSAADGFWIFVAVLMLEVGATTGLTSQVRQMSPMGWLSVQLLLAAATLPLTGGWRPPTASGLFGAWQRVRAGVSSFLDRQTVWGLLLLCLSGVAIGASLLLAVAQPLQRSDDWLYHASRVIYWIQNGAAFPYDSHVIQQVITPFGSELFFLWPVLLTKTEVAGRVMFSMALVLAAVGLFLVGRAMKLGQTASLVVVAIFVSTPLVMASAVGLRPELWATLALLGMAYWAIQVFCENRRGAVPCLFLGAFFVLAVNVRPFPLAVLPGLLLMLWWSTRPHGFWSSFRPFFMGLVIAFMMSGLWIPLAFNTERYQHPLGPPEARQVVKAEPSAKVVYTHAIRTWFLLWELPDLPMPVEVRDRFSGAVNSLINVVGAGVPLGGEADGPRLGRYAYVLQEQSGRFSLWGMFWMPVLLVASWRLARRVAPQWRRPPLTAESVLTLIALPIFMAIIFGARWNVHAEVPGRFLVSSFALALLLGASLLAGRVSGRKLAPALVAAAVGYAAYAPIRAQTQEALRVVFGTKPNIDNTEPFNELTGSLLPPGSRILLVANTSTHDYPLFSPQTGYSNTVVPWGSGPFEPARMDQLIASNRVTHILITDDQRERVVGRPPIDTREMVTWLNAEPGLRSVPLRVPTMRLYEVAGATAMNERPFQVTAIPASAPLIRMSDQLHGRVGLDPVVLQTPWPIEKLEDGPNGTLWLGQGRDEGLEFGLWARQTQFVNLMFRVSPGPGIPTPRRRILLLQDGMPVAGEVSFEGNASVQLPVRLHPGRNIMSFFGVDAATVNPLPNGDARDLVFLLKQVRIEPGAESASPEVAEMAGMARLASGLVASHQRPDGYWLTTHTAGTRFEAPAGEMNTYLTALMVDLLQPGADASGLGGSLDRARFHLRSQIEHGGLVRYHGKPGGRANTENGMCTISPDSDDTALTWRIAPGDAAGRLAALETLQHYRTAEGLYQTWLAQPGHTQCLNPGSDPNPPDVAIQMHLLMWLTQVDPPEARALCNALRKSIGEERLWVYYRRAPLVPVLRQPDLKAAGCELPLPAARVQTDVPGQQTWLDAVRMLVQLEEGNGPARREVLHLLQELSKDRFAPVRQNPPMLYHNDLTASVSRFYWSEDVGYAIWLRLYQLGVEAQP
ncbi:ArnT family glycosyltransferase [Hydrogenophaga sp. RWCD_12]|uniref:ArnT family glycosyltransferase n=1 Tax=Hydrogenophaga sp. RWCD_12 TaxID=3391190 RepID=UPI0039849194